MEFASAVFARAAELTLQIQRAELDQRIHRGDNYQKFRTGELRTFMELAKSAIDMGSRRITMAMKELEQREGAD